MSSDDLSRYKQKENWAGLENYLSKNLHPVLPRSVFIDNLRSRLENPDSVTLETVGKTSRYLFAVISLIVGLVVMVLTARLFVLVVSRARKR